MRRESERMPSGLDLVHGRWPKPKADTMADRLSALENHLRDQLPEDFP